MQLIQATEQDLNTISNLAREIWNQHYISIIGKEQVDYMLDKMYNLDSLTDQLFNKKHVFYLIKLDNLNIGFISISSENKKDCFLHKFYINQNKANSGIGTETLKQIESLLVPKTLTLTVNRQNFKSINFYFKNGFTIQSVEDFDIGNGFLMNDFVMIKRYN